MFSYGGRRANMKKNIHPKYVATKVMCACGNEFEVKSNKNELHLEVCDKCHPFFTGEQGTLTKTGRVEKFNRKYGLNK
jgi:large subunit ribosomal protein L31